jgi:xylulokinase
VKLYLGFDCSTQSLTAIVIEVDRDRTHVVFETSFTFDGALPGYGTKYGVLPASGPGIAASPPLMWADALDLMLGKIVASGLDLRRLAAISGSAQQHGSVYLNADAPAALMDMDPAAAPAAQMTNCLSRPVAPIWMDCSTTLECAEITGAVGGAPIVIRRTGSRAFERFTGPQIRKFFKQQPGAYAATDRIHVVSSFLASLLAGRHAAIDPGDASGMNLMDLAERSWWPAALDATAPELARKLPPIAAPWTIAGTLSRYWQMRHHLPAARIVTWSGDNPSSLIGSGLVREGVAAVSLGTSDTIFGLMRKPLTDPSGAGSVFGAPTGDFMGLTCFANGSLARERIRDRFGLTWSTFSAALGATPPGNDGRILVPWFDPEITPQVLVPGIRRFGLAPDDGPGHVRGVIEGQMLSMALHSRWMQNEMHTIHATGGASANRDILRVIADVFGAEVRQFQVTNSACLGAALRARHADLVADGAPQPWEQIVNDVVESLIAGRVAPRLDHHARYRELMRRYAECEALALSDRPS